MKSNKKNFFLGAAVLIIILAAILFYMRQKETTKKSVEMTIDKIEDIKGLGYSGQRKVAVDRNGDIFLAYRKKYQGKSEIFVAKVSSENNPWKVSETNRPISPVGSGVDQRVPSIAIGQNNDLYVVWYGSDSNRQPNNRQIKYSASSDGGTTWSSWKNISLVDGYASNDDFWQEHPYILSGALNELFVVWEGKDAGDKNQQIKFSRSADGGSFWSQWKNVLATPETTQSRPTIVQDQAGRLHLFMYSSFGNSSGKQQIQYSWSEDQGESWSQWKSISDPNFDSRHVTAALGSDGTLHIAWRAQDQTGLSHIMYRTLKGGTWSDIKKVSDSPDYQFFPSIGVSADGKVNIAWMESRNPSGLPSEDPTEGKVYISTLNSGKFSQPGLLSPNAGGLYPNIPEISEKSGLSVIFESKNASDSYAVLLKLIK